ncbi:MAG: putative dinitrogen iron-molybdenum cofactor biosynthesis protein [Deltaproteobacteria bacterium]|jgi:predicted Fe-Mo cluster-binding NifX family protein|nr:putative dinitrogen iron-molybdenum cofactor biosynthesis protein [Deltaproteobacteria bacterium]
MKIGFPVERDAGMESKVYGHFGSAPAFVVVDTEKNEVRTIQNQDLHHIHGACNPIRALDGQQLDSLVVGGIGGGALMKLNALGIRVYEAGAQKVNENLKLFKEDSLEELTMDHSCKAHQGGCGH